jgi:hypothetical protein
MRTRLPFGPGPRAPSMYPVGPLAAVKMGVNVSHLAAVASLTVVFSVAMALAPFYAQARPAHRAHTHRHAPVPIATTSVQAPSGPWSQWGNVGPSGIADCTFASAADWEQIVLGRIPVESELIREFHEAGGVDSTGLDLEQMMEFWEKRGINGVRVKLREQPTSRLGVLLRAHKALFVSVIWSAGMHALIVAGFNSTGPEIITWGETKQVTWAEWNTWSVALYLPVMI